MEKYYLNFIEDEQKNASSKAVQDCNQILFEEGYKPWTIRIKKRGNKIVKKILNGLEIIRIKKVPYNSILVVPHPIYLNKNYIDILKACKRKNNLFLVFLIHDLESLRKMFPESYKDFLYIDNTMLDIADVIIAHNQKMIDYLKSTHTNAKIYNLQIFDYLCSENKCKKRLANSLSIAGNLDVRKCGYVGKLKDLSTRTKFNLYGSNFDTEKYGGSNLIYKGSYPPDQIPNVFSEGFGLVWDGNSINTCSESTGEYLRYNNPHKLSLYIAAGLPVAIWEDAAECEFVIRKKIGLSIKSIEDFETQLNKMDPLAYEEMLNNVQIVSEELRNGSNLKRVIHEVEVSL